MNFIKEKWKGLLMCLAISIPSVLLGKKFPIIGGPVFAILIGMVLTMFIKNKEPYEPGIKYTSKKILQYAVVLLGFGMNLPVSITTSRFIPNPKRTTAYCNIFLDVYLIPGSYGSLFFINIVRSIPISIANTGPPIIGNFFPSNTEGIEMAKHIKSPFHFSFIKFI